jgi:8-oxo-dGTP diphosphatase
MIRKKIFKIILLNIAFVVFVSDAQAYAALVGNAGCMIKEDGRVLLVTQNNDKLSIPGGTAEDGEIAMQTAIREVYEETQVRVSVSKLLKSFDNGFHLFECDIIEDAKKLKPIEEYEDEIKSADFYDVENLSPDDLRFPDQYELYLGYQSQ